MRFRGSTKKTEKREARIVEAELLAKLKARRGPSDDWRLREVIGTYWDEHGQHRKTAAEIFHKLELLSENIGPDLPIAALTNALLMDYRAARRGGTATLDGEKLPAVQPQTVNRDLAHLQAAMLWARDVHGRPVPPIAWSKLKAKEAPHRIRFAGADEFAGLMKAAAPSMRAIILCAVTTGLRLQTILKLQWHQVDLDGRTITIPSGKGDKPHLVRIAPQLRAELARTPAAKRKGPTFDSTNWRKRWDAARAGAELVDFRFHDLRHTFASWARQNGADLADICEALNHSSVAVTQRYAHIKPDSATTAFDRVAELLTPKKVRRKRA